MNTEVLWLHARGDGAVTLRAAPARLMARDIWKIARLRAHRYRPHMSIAEVKATIRKMPRTKRRALLSFITALDQTDDPAWLAEVERRKKETKAGKKISRGDAMRLLGITEHDLAAAR